MSGRRWGDQTRLFVYAWLCERDGERCSKCGKRPAVLYDGTIVEPPASLNGQLEIDHINGNRHDNRFVNLRLLCKPCNIAIRNKIQPTQHSGENERKKREWVESSKKYRRVINFEDQETPITMKVNSQCEPAFEAWILKVIDERGYIPKANAINGGAHVVGCSPITSRRYVEKLTDPYGEGSLQETKNSAGETIIVRKSQ